MSKDVSVLRDSSFWTLVAILVLWCTVLGSIWLPKGATNQELLANYSKATEYWTAMKQVGGWPWWTHQSNMGHSLSSAVGTILTYAWIAVGSAVFGEGEGLGTGTKIMGLIFVLLSGLSMYAWVRAWTKDGWCALVCGVLYAMSPQMALRLAGNEHLVVAFCFPYVPLIFLALWRMTQRMEWKDSLLLALAYGGMTLTYVRAAVVLLPLLVLWAGWLWWEKRKGNPKPFYVGVARSVGVYFFLGVLPLLPFVRELKWMAMFQYDPFESWQRSFAMKTLVSWVDRGSEVLYGMPPFFTVDQGGFYIGAVALLTLAIVFLHSKSEEWLTSPYGQKLRLFLGMGLVLGWISLGHYSVLSGHLEFLRYAQGVRDWALPIAWFLLLILPLVIYRILPRQSWRLIATVVLSGLLYLLPVFRVVELFPFFGNIRAPWFFWEIAGTFCVMIATGLGLSLWVRGCFSQSHVRVLVSLALACLLVLDLSVYQQRFAKGELPARTWESFKALQGFLAERPEKGRVLFISGRYFYQMTPQFSGRGLVREAFHGQFMPRWTREMLDTPAISPELARAQFSLSGTAFVVVDLACPDTPPQVADYFRTLLPVVLENEHFLVFGAPQILYPAFLGQHYLAVLGNTEGSSKENLLATMALNYVPVEMDAVQLNEPFLVGSMNQEQGMQLKPEFQNQKGNVLLTYGFPFNRTNPHQFKVHTLPPFPAWVMLPESYHPDWKVKVNDRDWQPAKRAFGSLLAVQTPTGAREVTFEFRPPWWYNACMNLSALSWLGALVCFAWNLVKRRRKV